ncbi:hypothetical protein AOCH_007061 [Aspergillus ochraceoroseus]|uniref:Uncharacterized protein n=2 Tax=Aspergillus ochraceoroseus TaxID=138278 RepID=A0A0F8WWL4_9EURO|nr:hypothetical protein AOCH_007061 [Aspergillus ochraceoroseus]
MGLLVKLVGSGLGLGSEAIHAAREHSSSSRAATAVPPGSSAPNGPEHAELVDDSTAHRLVANGQAEYVVGQSGQAQQSNPLEGAPALDYSDRFDHDEAAWELDDMVEHTRPPVYEEEPMAASGADSDDAKMKMREAMVRKLVTMAGPAPQPQRRLACPVIIPQRRPRKKERGFVRAYAPILADCGISEEVFVQFLEDLDRANKASQWIEVVFVAAGILGLVPEPTTQILSAVVQLIAGTARELQTRRRENTFLDCVNKDLLMPRGLYAMIMTFKDQVPGQQQGVLSPLSSKLGQTLFSKEKLDLNQTVAKYSNPDPNISQFNKALQSIRLSSGKTCGELELPEAAELVYPDLDRVVAQAVEGKGSRDQPASTGGLNKFKGAGKWVQDYMDRRAHAFYEAEHPGTTLTVPSTHREPMKSRFNDPNHPANSGSLTALLTGGLVPVPGIETIAATRREQFGVRRLARGRSASKSRGGQIARGRGERIIKRIVQQDVLYLLIVNLPSEEEVQESISQLEHMMNPAGPPAASF